MQICKFIQLKATVHRHFLLLGEKDIKHNNWNSWAIQISGVLPTWQCADGVHYSIVGCEVMGLHIYPEELDVACDLIKAASPCSCPYAEGDHGHRRIAFLTVQCEPSEHPSDMLGSRHAFHPEEKVLALRFGGVLTWVSLLSGVCSRKK